MARHAASALRKARVLTAVDDAVQLYANGPTFAYGHIKKVLLRSSYSSHRARCTGH